MHRITRARVFVAGLVMALLVGVACQGGDPHPEGIGNYCEGDDQCETNLCYIGPGGGYCTSPCAAEGSVEGCPADTVCKPIQGGDRRCLLVCGSESACDGSGCPVDFCPTGSSCVEVSGSDLRACEPDP